ncbi:MAG: response regulator transcription factor [Methylococcaceae bacterium]|nr:MAG: response regulator transcription factor [Methylococcaceae bacterium]
MCANYHPSSVPAPKCQSPFGLTTCKIHHFTSDTESFLNILLIDDHFCAREGLALLLKQLLADVQVCEAQGVDEGLAVARATPLNLALLDVQLPDRGGLDGLCALRREFPSLCVVMFSALEDSELVFEALRLGAMGFIPKSVSRQGFVDALRDVLSGRPYLPVSAIGSGLARTAERHAAADDNAVMHAVSDPNRHGLTAREFQVLRWLVQGKCNKDIARRLNIEEQTVKNHLRPIFQKFGVTRRAELIVKVFEAGIVLGAPDVGNA